DAGTIDWIHRKAGDTDIYFVASRWQPAEKVEGTFRVSGRQPELWDPVTGAMRDAAAFHQQDGRTVVPLEFAPCGSTFVIFRKPIGANTAGTAKTNYPRAESQLTLSGTWEVSFDPKWGGPEKATFDQLVDWTTRPEPGIKFYSGTAIYRKEFILPTLPAKGTRLLLDLGAVHEVASVRLNGRDLGVVWTKPARVDITDAVKAAGNALEVTVMNLWPNRLIGDEALPKESQVTETNMRKFGSASPLLPSGLIGPVTVLSVREPQ
ncbi:MAG TPA: glycosylhydrolase-like jelly roll fold domain-containing protein, partial [Verrucomicrobiae bacterium]